MKKHSSLLVFFFIVLSKLSFSQCTPNPHSGIPGFSPQPDSLPHIQQGIPYAETVYFENWDTGYFTPGIEWLRFDSIYGLPPNISYAIYPDSFFTPGETGCISLFGTASTGGIYQLEWLVTLHFDSLGTFSGNLLENISSLGGSSADYEYHLTVEFDSGIQENELLQSFVYQNPNSKYTTIYLSRVMPAFDFFIHDISGKEVESLRGKSGEKIIVDTNEFQSGIYFYQIVSVNNSVSRGRFTITK